MPARRWHTQNLLPLPNVVACLGALSCSHGSRRAYWGGGFNGVRCTGGKQIMALQIRRTSAHASPTSRRTLPSSLDVQRQSSTTLLRGRACSPISAHPTTHHCSRMPPPGGHFPLLAPPGLAGSHSRDWGAGRCCAQGQVASWGLRTGVALAPRHPDQPQGCIRREGSPV